MKTWRILIFCLGVIWWGLVLLGGVESFVVMISVITFGFLPISAGYYAGKYLGRSAVIWALAGCFLPFLTPFLLPFIPKASKRRNTAMNIWRILIFCLGVIWWGLWWGLVWGGSLGALGDVESFVIMIAVISFGFLPISAGYYAGEYLGQSAIIWALAGCFLPFLTPLILPFIPKASKAYFKKIKKMKAKGNVTALAKILEYEGIDSTEVRCEAVKALGDLKAIESLIMPLKGSDEAVRDKTKKILTMLKEKEKSLQQRIESILGEKDETVKKQEAGEASGEAVKKETSRPQNMLNKNEKGIGGKKPVKRKYWKCPECNAILQKKNDKPWIENMTHKGALVLGMVTCGSCGAQFSRSDIYNGKYDAKIAHLLIMKQGSQPNNEAQYSREIVEALVPEALDDPDVQIKTNFQAAVLDETGTLVTAMMMGIPTDQDQYDVLLQNFTDAKGDKGILLKIYYKI